MSTMIRISDETKKEIDARKGDRTADEYVRGLIGREVPVVEGGVEIAGIDALPGSGLRIETKLDVVLTRLDELKGQRPKPEATRPSGVYPSGLSPQTVSDEIDKWVLKYINRPENARYGELKKKDLEALRDFVVGYMRDPSLGARNGPGEGS